MKCELKKENGMLAIYINGKAYAPVSFKSFRPAKKNISDFYTAGIRLFNILSSGIISAVGVPYSLYGESWVDEYTYDFDPIDRQIALFMEHAPEAYFALMLQLDTRPWWLKKYSGYPDSFRKLAQMEADPRWRAAAAAYMQAVLQHVEKNYGDRFYGYFLLAGTTTEWFSDNSFEDASPISEAAYKTWRNNLSAYIPSKECRETDEKIVFLDCQREENLIQYRKFESWQRSDTILYFAKKAQEVLKHQKLLGLYFGYIFELDGSRLWNTGHLDYERVFLSEDIDMFSSPVSYAYRAQDCGSHQMLTSQTLTANNKLYFIEHDQTTCLVPDTIEGQYFVHPNKAKTIEEDINLLRRDFLLAAANGCAMWWFDMFQGWFYNKKLMTEITGMVKASKLLFSAGYRSVSEIAVIVDPESMYFINKNSRMNTILLGDQRGELSLIGAPYDIFSSCDIKNIDTTQYKFFIFLDQFKVNPAADAFIAKLKDAGKAMLFVYAYNILDTKYDIAQMSKALGFNIIENPYQEDTIYLCNGSSWTTCAPKPCLAIAEDITVLGWYQNSKKAAFGYKKEKNALLAFSGLGTVSHAALTLLLKEAGVHQYTTSDEAVIYANHAMLGIYHLQERDMVLRLPYDSIFVDLFNGRREYVSKNCCLTIPYSQQRAKLFLKKEYAGQEYSTE